VHEWNNCLKLPVPRKIPYIPQPVHDLTEEKNTEIVNPDFLMDLFMVLGYLDVTLAFIRIGRDTGSARVKCSAESIL